MEFPTDLTPAQLDAGIKYLEASIAYARQKGDSIREVLALNELASLRGQDPFENRGATVSSTVGAIVVTARTVYGKDLIYPVSESAKVLTQLTGTATLGVDCCTRETGP